MTLKSLCAVHRCQLVTQTVTAGGAGGGIRTLTVAASNVPCRVVPTSAAKAAQYMQAGHSVDYNVYFTTNPRDTAGGKVFEIRFTDENGVMRYLRVDGEKNPDQLGRFWVYDCEETTAATGDS